MNEIEKINIATKPIIEEIKVNLFTWTIENSSDKKIYRRVLPNNFFDIIIPLDGYIIADNFKVTKPFVSPILTEPKDIIIAEKTKLFGLRISPIYFETLTGISPRKLKQTFNYVEELLPKHKLNWIQLLSRFENNSTFLQEGSAIKILEKTVYNKRIKSNQIIEQVISSFGKCENLMVSSIAKELNVSMRYLEKVFKNKLNLTVSGYRKILKFNKSISLLNKYRDYSLTDISYLSGYTDQSHFIKNFKEYSKLTPSKFRLIQDDFYKIMNG